MTVTQIRLFYKEIKKISSRTHTTLTKQTKNRYQKQCPHVTKQEVTILILDCTILAHLQ